jgi:hypothetical protein
VTNTKYEDSLNVAVGVCTMPWHMNGTSVSFIGMIAKFWKVTISLPMSVCQSICMKLASSHWMDIHENWCLSLFQKFVKKIQVWWNSEKNDRYFTWRPVYILIISCSVLLRMRNVSDKSCRENQNTCFIFSNFLLKNCVVYDIMW